MKEFIRELSKREIFFIAVIAVFFAGSAYFAWNVSSENDKKAESINSFAQCAAAGNPIMESYPEQCAAGGKTFTNPDQEVDNNSNSAPATDTNMQTNISLSSVPEKLQNSILETYKEKAPECISEDAKITDITNYELLVKAYIPDGFATVLIGCDSGSVGLFAYSSNEWKFLESSQGAYTCETLEGHQVPYQIITGYKDVKPDCMDKNGESRPVNY